MDLIIYKKNTVSKNDMLLHLQKCDHRFVPPLSERVVLDNYVEKLKEFATTFEAWHTNELVGVISVYLNDENEKVGFISNVSVLEEFEGKGIAGKLVRMVKEHASESNFTKLSLEVNFNNIHAIRFYERHGFESSFSKEKSIYMNCSIN